MVTLDEESKVDRIAVVGDQKTLFDLVLYGAYQPESLIAKLISSLGSYRIDILKRAKAGFQTELHEQKLKITVFSQRLLAAFLPFERFIHAPKDDLMFTVLSSLEQEIRELYTKLGSESYGPRLKAELNRTKENLCAEIKLFREKSNRKIDDCKELLIGISRIITRQGQTLNRTITEDDVHSRAVLRGNLNNYFENNFLIINNYDYDFNKPIFPQHQGLLPDSPDSQGVLLSDLVGIRDLAAVALVVDEISKSKNKRRADLGKNLEASDIPPLPLVINPKWRGIDRALASGARRFASEIYGFVKDTVLIPKKIYKAIRPTAQRNVPIDHTKWPKNATDIIEVATRPHKTWYSRLGKILLSLAKRAITKPVVENFKGSLVALREKLAELKYYRDHQTITPSELFISSARRRERVSLSNQQQSLHAVQPRLLYAPYSLSDHGSSTLLNAAAHGAESFIDTFVHNIHGKHPIIGAIYSILGASSAGAVWFGLGGPKFAGAMIQLSNAVSSGTTFGGVSTGSTVAQLSVVIAEAITHGHESWAARGLKLFSENPITITSGLIAGFAVGYVITEVAKIPFVSSYLEDELGSIPEIAQFFAGMKIAAVSFEVFLPPAQGTILKGDRLPEIPSQLTENNTLLLEQLKTWNDVLPFLPQTQKAALKERMGSSLIFKYYQSRLEARLEDLIQDGTLLKLGGALAYLSNNKKFAILNACKNYKQYHLLDELLFPHAKRSVVGETVYRILRPPVRIIASVGLAAKALAWDSWHRGKVGKTLRFASKELGRAVVRDIGKELVGDSVKALFKMGRTTTKAIARVVKSTAFVAPLSLAAKTKKMIILAARRFKAKPVTPDSPIEIGNINLLKKHTGDAVDAARTGSWFDVRNTWQKLTTNVNAAFHKLEHSVLGKQPHSEDKPIVNRGQGTEESIPKAHRISDSFLHRTAGTSAIDATATVSAQSISRILFFTQGPKTGTTAATLSMHSREAAMPDSTNSAVAAGTGSLRL